jgi:4-hydroxy-2-oxoheptanedioate aldolase
MVLKPDGIYTAQLLLPPEQGQVMVLKHSENDIHKERRIKMKNALREKLEARKKPVGTFFSMGSGVAVEALGIAGMDYVVLDKEHGPYGVETIAEYIRCAERRNITPVVRVKDFTRPSILKVLDIGAQGIIIPMIKTKNDVERVIEYSKFFPMGNRGVAPTRASSFGNFTSLEDYFEESNSEILVLPQCETKECVENIDDILSVDGVDGVFIGPYDLSQSLGKPGQFTDPVLQNAIDLVLSACKEHNKYSLIYASDKKAAMESFGRGFDSVSVGMDILLYIETFRDIANMPR